MSSPESTSAVVIGCGLIGTSVGLALRKAGWRVLLADVDEANVATAVALGAGERWLAWPPHDSVVSPAGADITIVAVPPSHIAEATVLAVELDLSPTIMHVCSVQSQPQREMESLSLPLDRLVGTHPMAGRERGGAEAATGLLFRDRPWVVCDQDSSVEAVAGAVAVITACGARVVKMATDQHDHAVALVSHLPQLVASALAAQLNGVSAETAAIAGTGLRDMTRLAAADGDMWPQIIAANVPAVRAQLTGFTERLTRLTADLDSPVAVAGMLGQGRAGRTRLGGKHGGGVKRFGEVHVVVADEPGTLVDVLLACRDLGINVEDLAVDHAPGNPVGLLKLLVDPNSCAVLAAALTQRGWEVAGVFAPHE